MKIPLMRWNDFRHERIIFPQWADTIIGQWNKHQFDADIKSLGAQNIMALAETNFSIYTDHKAFKNFFPQHWDISEYMGDVEYDTETLNGAFWDACDEQGIKYMNWKDEDVDKFTIDRLNDFKEEMFLHDKIRTQILREQDFSFAFPSYKDMFVMIGNPVNHEQEKEVTENTQLGALILHMDEERQKDFGIENEEDLAGVNKMKDGETFLYITFFAKSGSIIPGKYDYSLESQCFVSLDKDGRPLVYSTAYHNLDQARKFVRTHKLGLRTPTFNEDNLVQLLQEQCEIESMFSFVRTVMLLELFQILNTKSSDDVQIFKEDIDKSAGKREYKKAKKKGYDGPADAFVFKTLKINPNLTVPKKNGKGRERLTYGNLKEHSRRGHRKVYTADKPRLGINHPNHIGAFWYKESIVGDIREGIVHKDYKVESEEE